MLAFNQTPTDREVQQLVPLTPLVPAKSDSTLKSRPTPATHYTSLFKYFAIRLCVVVTLAVILLGAVELYSYRQYLPAAQNAMEPAFNVAENGNSTQREYRREFEQANHVLYHQYVLWRHAPYQGAMLAIDQDGVRRTLHTRCDNTTFTIWMFGDSVMWSAGAPDEDSIPSLVALDYEKAGKPVCIVNYAEKGWANTQEMVGLIENLKHAARKPDVVLFYDGGTEAFTAYQSGRADVHSNYNSFRDFLDNWGASEKASFSYFSQTNTYRLLERIAVKKPFHVEPYRQRVLDTETLPAAVMKNYLQNMGIVNLLAKQYGFRAIFVWYPNLLVGHKQLTPSEQQVLQTDSRTVPNLDLMYQAVYQKGRELKRPDFYYLGDLLDDQKSSLYVGLSHLNIEGDRIVADRLYDILEHRAHATDKPSDSVAALHAEQRFDSSKPVQRNPGN
ncbi:MAG: SGNH/GDSL hydrolase family protein [Candidatus Sulfotelmatobacter sp.]